MLLVLAVALAVGAIGSQPAWATRHPNTNSAPQPPTLRLNHQLQRLQETLGQFAVATTDAEYSRIANQAEAIWSQLNTDLDIAADYLPQTVAPLSPDARPLAQARTDEALQAFAQRWN
jgi:hypothetical protein